MMRLLNLGLVAATSLGLACLAIRAITRRKARQNPPVRAHDDWRLTNL